MTTIQESFKANPLNLTHILPLDFDEVQNVPDTHTWSTLDSKDSPNPTPIPVIDLHDPNAIALLQQACEEWGVFQITNHGIPMSLLDEVEFETRRLFTLPAKEKLKTMRSPENLTGYGLARLSSFYPKLMWSEAFTIAGSPVEHARQLWPNDYINFCNVMEKYQTEMEGLSKRVVGLMLTLLGLTVDEDVKWINPETGSNRPQEVLHLNSYPVCPDPTHAMGLAPHTDSTIVTLLYQSNVSGLQLLRDGDQWMTVEPVAGALVVNVGDLMHILSNGKFKTTLHRAVVNGTNHRISVAYFYGPPKDVMVSPSTKLIDDNHPPLYRPVTWKEYLDVKATHLNKALEVIRYENC